MLRKVISVMVGMVLPLFSVIPANAAEIRSINQAAEMQERMILIDQLITEAGDATRSGDVEKADSIHAELASLGVEMFDSLDEAIYNEDIQIDPQYGQRSLPVVPDFEDTEAVKWYKMTYTNYYDYQLHKYYDLISLRAEAYRDLREGYVYSTGVSFPNQYAKCFGRSLLDNTGLAIEF